MGVLYSKQLTIRRTALTAVAANAGAAIVFQSTTGNTTTGVSNAVLDRSTVGTGTDMVIQLIRKLDKPDNEYGDYCKWVVRIARHRYAAGDPIHSVLI